MMRIQTRKLHNPDASTASPKQARRGVTLEDNRNTTQPLQVKATAQPASEQPLQLAIGENGNWQWVVQKSTSERFWAVRNTIGSYDLYQDMTFIMSASPDNDDFELLNESGFNIFSPTTSGRRSKQRGRGKAGRKLARSSPGKKAARDESQTVGKKRGRQQGERSSKKRKIEIENDFSDSALDDSSDSDVAEVAETTLHQDRALSAGTTKIILGNEWIGGSELIAIAQKAIKEVIDSVAGDELPAFDEQVGSRVVVGGADWLKGLGTMSKMISGKQRRPLHQGAIFNSMENPIAPRTGKETGSLSVGQDQSRMSFKLQNKLVRVSPQDQPDYEYEDLLKKLGELRDQFGVTDSQIALAMLQLVRTGAIDDSSPLAGNANAVNLLNFANTLGIGVEGSQLNTNAFHYVTILEDVFSNLLSLEEAFFMPPFGGAIPMATVGAKNKEGQIAVRRQGLIDDQQRGTVAKPRGQLKPWQKDSTRRHGRVSSMRTMRGSQSSHPVILKEALNLTNIGRRLVVAGNIQDKSTFIDTFIHYVKGTMLENFGGKDNAINVQTLLSRQSPEGVQIPPVKIGSLQEAENRGWNAGDRFEIESDNSRYFVVLKNHFGGESFVRGDIWMKLRGG